MAIDPVIQAILDQAPQDAPKMSERSVEEGRANYLLMAAIGGAPPELAEVRDITIPGPAGAIGARVYRPAGDTPLPVTVYFHGGGWTIGSVDTHHPMTAILAERAGTLVVSVDYRLGPEHPYPAAVEDALAATRWVAEQASELGGDPSRLAVAGDSAGGNLAAVCALHLRDLVRFQLLIYPAVDSDPSDHPSRTSPETQTMFLNEDSMAWFWRNYSEGVTIDHRDPDVSPLRAPDHTGVARAFIVTAEHDPLRDEGEAYARKLEAAGVPVELKRYPGMTHAFAQMAGIVPTADAALHDMAQALAKGLAG